MKAALRLHRRAFAPAGSSISLFPFLAVLVCTMGALVPLLLVITRTARHQAEAEALARMSESAGQLETRREDVRWRIEQLRLSREKTEAQLADARLELGHLEDHARRLRAALAQYQQTLADLEKNQTAGHRHQADVEAELAQTRRRIDAARRHLAETQQAAAERGRSYAVVPYEGPNQTRRRPIYLECRADAVVLQPEGVALSESDFEGPLGPGNPLAVALRAAREYLLAQREFDPQSGEPYPLLLVRPDGINAYYAARTAMKSWGFDFGYELIESDWNLAYPPPDLRLADLYRRTLSSARASQARLIAAAPRHYGNQTRVTYRAAPGGGLLRETEPADEEQGARGPESAGRGMGGEGRGTEVVAANPVRSAPRVGSNVGAQPTEGYVAGQPPRERPATPDQGAGGNVLRPGEWQPSPERPPKKTEKQDAEPRESLAKQRGADWGLRDAARGSVGLTRPIRVECYADRLIVISDRGPAHHRTVPLGPRTADAVDALVSTVWEHIEAWGIAGRGMYWRPQLQFHVAADAQSRFADLAVLLEGSGLLVERK